MDRGAIDKEARTVTLSFSSETPVDRWFGFEILDHSPGSIRMGRLKDGGPLLVNHDGRDQIGVVESAEIGPDKRGHAVLRFGKSSRAQEIFDDVLDGIRRNVSVGYWVHRMVLEEEDDKKGNTYRAMDWEPLEISIVPIPADVSVGVGRSHGEGDHETIIERSIKMPEPTVEKVDVKKIEADVQNAEYTRVNEILAIGDQHKCQADAARFIREKKSVEEFKNFVLETRYKAKPVDVDPNIGLNEKERKQFSIVRAIHSLASGKGMSLAPFEKECSDAVAERFGKGTRGFFVPFEVLTEKRDLTKGSFTGGGALVDTQLLVGSFIDLLRKRMMVRKMGATILGGLVGDIAIPRQSGGATAYWVGENVAPTESQQTVGQLGMTPKTVGAYTDISRKLSMQSSLDVEGFVRNDLATVIALALDLAAINGLGAAGEPLGILNTTGIGDVAGGANGLAPTWAHMVNLWKEVAIDNADFGTLGYLTNAAAVAKLATTEKASSTAQYIVSDLPNADGFTAIAGMRCGVSNQVPSNLAKGSGTDLSAIIFGNWADLIIAEWGALDVLVDPYTGGAAGTTRIRLLQDVDVAIRHAESFSAMKDAITT